MIASSSADSIGDLLAMSLVSCTCGLTNSTVIARRLCDEAILHRRLRPVVLTVVSLTV